MILCSAVSLATIAVIVLAVVSPQKKRNGNGIDVSLYIQCDENRRNEVVHRDRDGGGGGGRGGALMFRRVLTEGPENSSRVVGRAQGFVILTNIYNFDQSPFNVVYLSFHNGTLTLHPLPQDQFQVIGGTGSFAFARGLALFTQTHPSYHLKLHLHFSSNTNF
ncbi:hypothetical protein VNO78_10007 [Psophocarpus tetragonolobus]|uniref:Dirigent protein n=1 Tax=Psophocarpus tetragonolobus TaxID=3891 RepID=A0AAN9SJ24_PSOTE